MYVHESDLQELHVHPHEAVANRARPTVYQKSGQITTRWSEAKPR
jgi:hypothetical protein